MATTIRRVDLDAVRLARCYQFARDSLVRLFSGDEDDIDASGDDGPGCAPYVLPACWGPSNPVWSRIVRLAAARGIDAVRYTRWCLQPDRVGLLPNYPEPNQLLGSAPMDAFAAALPSVREEIDLLFLGDLRAFCSATNVNHTLYGMTPTRAQLCAVTDSFNSMTPLGRYVVARICGGEEMRRREKIFRPDALFQFGQNPDEYQAAYGQYGHIPAGFAADAAAHYHDLAERYDNDFAGGRLG